MKKVIRINESDLIGLIKNIIVEQDDNSVEYEDFTPQEYMDLLKSVNYKAQAIPKFPDFRGKKIRVNGNLKLIGLKQITNLGELIVTGDLNVRSSGIVSLEGVTVGGSLSHWDTPYQKELDRIKERALRRAAEGRREEGVWNLDNPDIDDEGLMANAVFDYMVQEGDIEYLDESEREELRDLETRMEELEERINNEEDSDVLDELDGERINLEEEIDDLKKKNNDVYDLIPQGTHYYLTTFRSIHDETSGNIYAVGSESEADSSLEDHYEEMVNDLNNFDKSTLSYYIDGDDVAEYYEDMIREWVMDDPENYDVSRETSLRQDKEIEKLQNQKRSLEIETYLLKSGARYPLTEEEVESMKYFKFNDYMDNILIVEWSENKWQIYQNGKKVESVTYEDEDEDGEHESDNDSRMDEIESEIEDIDVEIQDIKDDPDGDLNDDEVEEAVEDRLQQIKDDPVSWLDEMSDQYENFVNTKSLLSDLVDGSDYGSINGYNGEYDNVSVGDSTFVVMRID
jgi:hypothetical protein